MNRITGLALPRGDDTETFNSYHFSVPRAKSAAAMVVETNDVRANMRDIMKAPDQPYAAHTAGRNSYAVGMAIMGMRGSRHPRAHSYRRMRMSWATFCAREAARAFRYPAGIVP